MSRAETIGNARHRGDPTNPAVGTKLWFGVVAARLGYPVRSLAADATAAGVQISPTGIADVMSNKWPVRTDRATLKQVLERLLAARKATDVEIEHLWHAHRRGAAGHHRGPDERAPVLPPYQPKRRAPTVAGTTSKEYEMLLAKQTLSLQARKHFGLFTNPFGGEVMRDQDFFNGDDFAWVREAAWQCVQNASFVAVVGESGAGKTTILTDLQARTLAEARGITFIKPFVLGMEASDSRGHRLSSSDILHAVITTLEPTATVPQTDAARSSKANKLLQESAAAGNSHLLLVEEAHALSDATLKHLKRLHELRLGRKPLLGILLLGQPELKTRLEVGLNNGKLREVAQRCEVVQLLPLDNDLQAYLQCRMQAAGKVYENLFDADFASALRERLTKRDGEGAVSMCYPLAVNNIVTCALNEAARSGASTVPAVVFKCI